MNGKSKYFVLLLCVVTFNVSFAQSDFWRDDITLWFNKGEELRWSNDMEGADTCYEKVYDIIVSDEDKILQNDGLDYFRVKSLWFVGLGYRDMGLATQESYYYSKAVKAFSKMAELSMRIEGERSTEYADALHDVGSTYYSMKDYSQAAVFLGKELNILLDSLDVFDSEFETLYDDLGTCYYEMNNYAEAVGYFERELVILKREYGEDDAVIKDVLVIIGECYSEMEQYDDAKNIYETLLDNYTIWYSDTSAYYADYLDDYAECCCNLGLYDEAKEAYIKAVAIMESFDDEDYYLFASTMILGLESCLFQMKDYDGTLYWMDKRQKFLQKAGEDASLSSSELVMKGLCYINNKDYEKAVASFLQALAIQKEQGENYMPTLMRIASCYKDMDRYDMAILYYEEVLTRKSVDSEYVACLREISSSYKALGNYNMAIDYLNRALEPAKEIFGDRSEEYATLLNNLGIYYCELKHFDKGIELLTKALSITKTAVLYNNLGEIYEGMGSYHKALSCFDESMRLMGDFSKDESELYCTVVNNKGCAYINLGEFEKGIACYEEVYDIKQKYGHKRSSIARSLNNLAVAYGNFGDTEKSLEYGQKALTILRELYGEVHKDIANSLNNLAVVYIQLKDYKKAESYLLQSLAVNKEIYGDNHPSQYATLYSNLGFVYCGLGRKKEMAEYSMRYAQIIKDEVMEKFSYLSNKERTMYWNKYNWFFTTNMPSYADILQDDDAFICATYDGLLFSKGLLLNVETGIRDMILNSGDPVSLELFGQLQDSKSLLYKEYRKPIAERLYDVDSLENHVNLIEKELQKRCAAYGEFNQSLNIGWEQVKACLGTNDLAIEFMEVPLRDEYTFYCALLLKKDYKVPRFVELFAASEMTRHGLYDLVWGPLEKELDGVENVYFSAAGELYRLPIEYAANEIGPVNEQMHLYRLSSTRQIVDDRTIPRIENAVVYGGMKYDFEADDFVTDNQELDRNRGHVITDYSVGYLEGTLKEADAIYQLLSGSRIETSLIVGEDATEASFKALSGSHVSVVHVATHGFYLTEEEADMAGEVLHRQELIMDDDRIPIGMREDYDLSRSAILFSGANEALREDYQHVDGVEDGILTATEISNLNLQGTDLLVLSACETGLGKISGEGVSGLQRGFKMAGVNSILMSLWDVDDQATQILMTEFYRNYVAGKSKAEALQIAQKRVRDTPGYDDPMYWAAFILLDGISN